MLSDEERKAINQLKADTSFYDYELKNGNYIYELFKIEVYKKDIDVILNLIEKQSKEIEELKEKNKRAEELYIQHNQMIIDILKECDYMIKNRYYMNDTAIRQHAEDIKNIAKYYIKQPEWEEE